MSSLFRPVGPLSASVYWRRRALALVALIAVLALLWWLLRTVFGGDDTVTSSSESPSPTASATATSSPTATPSPTGSPSASPTASATGTASPTEAGVAPLCDDAAVAVSVKTDRRSYAPDQDPLLTLRVVNNGTTACRRDVGQAALELRVQAGEQREWSSDDCNPGGDPNVKTLQPGAAESVTVTWNRLRSAPGCPDGLGAAPPGDYQAFARAGTLTSTGAAFTLE